MSELQRASWLAVLSAMILCAAVAGCGEQAVRVPRSSFDLMLGHQGATDTNLTAKLTALQADVKQQFTNDSVLYGMIQKLESRIMAMEARPVIQAPLTSAPVVIPQAPIEKPEVKP